MTKTLSTDELEILLGHAQEEVAAMEAIKARNAAATHFLLSAPSGDLSTQLRALALEPPPCRKL